MLMGKDCLILILNAVSSFMGGFLRSDVLHLRNARYSC